MTESERLAYLLLNEVRPCGEGPRQPTLAEYREALIRAIERHEAFRQEVSDAVTDAIAIIDNGEEEVAIQELSRFIIAKPDPLEKLLQSIAITLDASDLREALDEAGLEIRERSNG